MERKTAPEILLRCLRFSGEVRSAEIESLLRTLTPDERGSLVRAAVGHEIAPLLYRRLAEILQESGPPFPPLKRLRAIYLQTAARNMRLYDELRTTLEALKKAEIPVIPLKGAYLAEAAYQDIALRVFSDIDILIRKFDLIKAHEIFTEMSFIPLEYHQEIAEELHEWHYVHRSSGWNLEVHWDIVSKSYSFTVNADRLWENSLRRTISGVDVFVLSPEDTLLHLCLSASIHNYSMGLRALYDISQFVATFGTEIDWTRVWRQAHEWKATRSAYLTLRLARDLLNAGIPEDLLENLKPSRNIEILYETARAVVLKDENSPSAGILVLPTMSVLLGKKRWREKLRLLLKKVFPSREFIAGQFAVSARSIWAYFFYSIWIIALVRRNYPSVRGLFFRWLTSSKGLAEEKKRWRLSDWLLSP